MLLYFDKIDHFVEGEKMYSIVRPIKSNHQSITEQHNMSIEMQSADTSEIVKCFPGISYNKKAFQIIQTSA